MKVDRFPIYKADYIFNKFNGEISMNKNLKYKEINILYPCRLDAMAINPGAVCYNDSMIFTPGEVVISVNKYIKVSVKIIAGKNELSISKETKRKVLVKHAYYLMKAVLSFKDSMEINVIDEDIPKHCGFGSSSSTISAVAAAINELYNHPISNEDLIKYLASNHGEEITDENENDLKMVQCIGGGATGGLTDAGIIIIAGKSTTICKMKYEGKVLIAIPNDFVEQNADILMEKEENNLWKFKETGDKYSKEIAYNLLHKALPGMVNGSINELAEIVFDYRFNMGSIENCSFVYEKMIEQGKELRKIYENGMCEFLALSSVGPAYFVIVKDDNKKEICKNMMEKLNMRVIETSICNTTYNIENSIEVYKENYWDKKQTAIEFTDRPPSKYITDVIDEIINQKEDIKCLDIGCGGGRYSRYLKDNNINIVAIDKYSNMASSLKTEKIKFINACFDNIPLKSKLCNLILSIGVIHNAVTKIEYEKAISEMYRLLKEEGYLIFSVFTNDVITDDLISKGNDCYNILNRPPMVLLSKKQIDDIFAKYNFKCIKRIDEHVTDVGDGGKRNVYTVLFQK